MDIIDLSGPACHAVEPFRSGQSSGRNEAGLVYLLGDGLARCKQVRDDPVIDVEVSLVLAKVADIAANAANVSACLQLHAERRYSVSPGRSRHDG